MAYLKVCRNFHSLSIKSNTEYLLFIGDYSPENTVSYASRNSLSATLNIYKFCSFIPNTKYAEP